MKNALLYAEEVFFDESITKEDILKGYIEYEVKSYDSIFSIISKFRTSIDIILKYNKGINMYNIEPGTKLLIPITNIIPTDTNYGYDMLELNIKSLKTLYPFLEVGSIGTSEMGKDIPYIKVGKGKKEVFYTGAIHANEWITSLLLMSFIEEFSKVYMCDRKDM